MASLVPLLIYTILYWMSTGVSAHSTGAPSEACVTMTPNHAPNSPQTGSSLYEITTNYVTYTPGMKSSITLKSISGNDVFAGFMIQARAAGSTEPVGTFTADPTMSKIVCAGNLGNALTHTSSTAKSELIVEWTAPAATTGPVTFYVTFVKAFTMFWVQVPSAQISPSTTTTTTTTTTTAKPSGSAGLAAGETVVHLLTVILVLMCWKWL